ncbi:MAG: UDP-N-acetylmuramate--L-alanine ligase [Sedimentisphaerales bacterium]|nr:UDP-N-acetylmuramate--L-alanine ligase [Sedimentisphaerales bacterium]
MSRARIQTQPAKVRAAHRYEVVNVVSRPKVAGVRFHFVGAGGIGMSGLAQFLLEKHAIVTGSDQSSGVTTARLSRKGAQIHVGHDARNVDPQAEVVVVSAAIQETNPELQQARRQSCRVYKYAQLLGEMMSHFEGVAVAGTHGKSTTSGWLAYCLRQAGVDANFVVGAEIPQLGASAGTGNSEFFVAEACEYDRSFLNIRPKVACLLNIERDHLDCYPDEAAIVEAFYLFARGTKPEGLVVANGHDPNVARVIERLDGERAVVTFGFDTDCDFCARNLRQQSGLYRFDAFHRGQLLGSTAISLPGAHNVSNALAVIAVAVSIGVEPAAVLDVLDRFTGMDRRLMLKGQFDGITVLDDYAHHPTEIKASLGAIRARYQPKRLWCVYQAHQYSRTRFFLEEFAVAFGQADKVLVPEIYFVRDCETSRSEVNGAILADRICRHGTDAVHLGTFEQICDHLVEQLRPGDLVVTMGAGDVWKVADEYIQRLGRNR